MIPNRVSCGNALLFWLGWWSLLVSSGALLDGAPDERSLEELKSEAFSELEDNSIALAQPLFEEIFARSRPESIEWREARFYVRYCRVALAIAQRDGIGYEPETELSEEISKLDALATELREKAERSVPRWLAAFERLANLYFSSYRSEEKGFELYGEIFQFWSESTDLSRARTAYLELAWNLFEQHHVYFFRADKRFKVIENAAAIAEEAEDVARFNWLYASVLGVAIDRPTDRLRQGEALKKAVSAGSQTEFFTRSLWDLGEWYGQFGHSSYTEEGELIFEPDYVAAKESFQRLASEEDSPRASMYRERASHRVRSIESRQLDVLVDHSFRPGTEIQLSVRWRNLSAPLVEIFPLDPFEVEQYQARDWGGLDSGGQEPVYSTQLDAEPKREHYPESSIVRVSADLAPGAYLVQARSGDVLGKQILFVTDLVAVSQPDEGRLIVYVCEASDGVPVAEAQLRRIAFPETGEPIVQSGSTGPDGLARFPAFGPSESRFHREMIVVAKDGFGAVVNSLYQTGYYSNPGEYLGERRMFLMTDRSLYRPADDVRMCLWIRGRDAPGWDLPESGTEIEYSIYGYSGNPIAKGTAELDSNGSASLSAVIPTDAQLGVYWVSVEFTGDAASSRHPLRAQAFRVEQFRTPEIRVKLDVSGDVPGVPQSGDTLKVAVQAEYYAGGAVEGADVELVVRRRPFQRFRPYVLRGGIQSFGSGEEIERIALETDAKGRVDYEMITPNDPDSDWVYSFEARVRDLSRREMVASAETYVMRQSYFAELTLERMLLAPGDRAELTIRTFDANDAPVSDEGFLKITRERWREIYVHRKRGSEISGEEFRALPDRSLLSAAQSDYRLKEEGFVTELISSESISTNGEGNAQVDFVPTAPGYYHFSWISRGERGQPIIADAQLWVSDSATTEIGYRPGGIQIVADKGPFRLGEPINYLITTLEPGCHVFLVIKGSEISESRVIKVEGTSSLVRFTPSEIHQPNGFIRAVLVSDEELFVDDFEFEVPHSSKKLSIEVTSEADGFLPRETGHFRIRVTDQESNPVKTNLTVSVSDGALFSIQPRMNPEPTDVFYGFRNWQIAPSGCSLSERRFFRPVQEETPESAEELSTEDLTIGSSPLRGMAEGSELMLGSAMTVGYKARGASAQDRSDYVVIRSDFHSTIFWDSEVSTDENGEVEVSVTFPDNLTEWKMEVVSITEETDVGKGELDMVTRLPLVARLHTPRFAVEGDQLVISGVLQNNSEHTLKVDPRLSVEGPIVLDEVKDRVLEIEAGETRRVEWKGTARESGSCSLTLSATSEEFSDGVKQQMEVLPHGIESITGFAGISQLGRCEFDWDLPDDAILEKSELSLSVSPSIAGEIFGAIPYLIKYPYGCSEQTLSRFLPVLVLRRSLADLGYDLDGIDRVLYAQIPEDVRRGRESFSKVLSDIVSQAIDRLVEMQRADGSWSWMPGGESDPYMTAYCLWGLGLAADYGVPLAGVRFEDARNWLHRYLENDGISAPERVWILHALASRYRSEGFGRPTREEARDFLDLMRGRERLRPISLALLTLIAKYFGFEEDSELLIENLANSAVFQEPGNQKDSLPDGVDPIRTLFWGSNRGYHGWAEGAVETTAWVVQALHAVDPTHEWIQPAVYWLVRNREGVHWGNTRSTAISILSMASYLRNVGNVARASDIHVSVNGHLIENDSRSIEQWGAGAEVLIPSEYVLSGSNRILVEAPGQDSPLFYRLTCRYFAGGEPIRPASSEVEIAREYWYLRPAPTLLGGVRETKVHLSEGEVIQSGDRVEVVLRISTDRDLRYVLVEDNKPGGFEPVQLLSGPGRYLERVPGGARSGSPIRSLNAYQELGERAVAFLIPTLPAGTWELRYRLRAETPGIFHTMPASGEAMYLPHVGGNSGESLLQVDSVKKQDPR